MKTKAFISYSRRDIDFVDRLVGALEDRAVAVSIDRTEIYSFEDWWKRIQRLIAEADTIVFVLSPDSIASKVCRQEVDYALSLKKRFAPIVCRPVADRLNQIPAELAQLNFVFFDDPDGFGPALDKLVEALATDIGWVREHTQYGLESREWVEDGKPSGSLLRSPRLEEAERWVAARPAGAPVPTDEMRAFLAESRRGATRRRNILTGSLAAALLIAIGLSGLAFWQRNQAVEQKRLAELQHAAAERNFSAAKQTVDGLIYDIAQGLENVAGMRIETKRRILDTVRKTVDKLLATAPNDALLLKSKAVMLDNFATIYSASGAKEDALEAIGEGLDIYRKLQAREPLRLEWVLDVINRLNASADVELDLGRESAAGHSLSSAMRMETTIWAGHQTDRTLIVETIITHSYLGDLFDRTGSTAAALESYERSLNLARRLASMKGSSKEGQRRILIALSSVSAAKRNLGDLSGALAAMRESLERRRAIAASDPDNTLALDDVRFSLTELGDLQLRLGDAKGAVAVLGEGVDVARRLVALDPKNDNLRSGLALSLERLAAAKRKGRDRSDAFATIDEAVALRRELVARARSEQQVSLELAGTLTVSAQVRMAFDDNSDALDAANEALLIARKVVARSPKHPRFRRVVAAASMEVGTAKSKLGDRKGSIAAFEEALDILRTNAGDDPGNLMAQRDLYGAYSEAGWAAKQAEMVPEALDFLRKARVIAERLAAARQNDAVAKRELAWVKSEIATLERNTPPSEPGPDSKKPRTVE